MTSEQVINTIVPYCERLSSGNEPFNTITNAAFLIVAVYSWHRLRNIEPQLAEKLRFNLMLLVLCVLPALIGVGSALFHARPSPLTHMLDIIPVCLFAIGSFSLLLINKGWPSRHIAITLFVWIGATAIAAQWPQVLAHSLFYLPTVLVLLFLSLVFTPSVASSSQRYCSRQEKRLLAFSTIAFATALLFRATDLPSCSPWSAISSSQVPEPTHVPDFFAGIAGSLGTHFLWHLLTALVCCLITALLIAGFENRTKLQRVG